MNLQLGMNTKVAFNEFWTADNCLVFVLPLNICIESFVFLNRSVQDCKLLQKLHVFLLSADSAPFLINTLKGRVNFGLLSLFVGPFFAWLDLEFNSLCLFWRASNFVFHVAFNKFMRWSFEGEFLFSLFINFFCNLEDCHKLFDVLGSLRRGGCDFWH
jgi:hypothetical protein